MNIDKNIVIEANRSALNFHISTVERVKQLCDPLKYLGIPVFGYTKIFDDSRYLRVCNKDRWGRYFIQNVHDTGKVISKMLSLADSEVLSSVWTTDETTDDLILNLKSHHNNNLSHGMSFYKRTDNFIEHWGFCGQGVYEVYLKRSDLLWKFAQYFSECAEDLIDHSDPSKLGIFKNGHNILPQTNLLGEENIGKFLQGIETRKYFIKCNRNWAFISEKEKQCLELAVKGLGQSSQTGLSSYIVGRHLDEVKFRLGAACINEVLDAFKECQL